MVFDMIESLFLGVTKSAWDYKCGICSVEFSRQSNATNHIKTAHPIQNGDKISTADPLQVAEGEKDKDLSIKPLNSESKISNPSQDFHTILQKFENQTNPVQEENKPSYRCFYTNCARDYYDLELLKSHLNSFHKKDSNFCSKCSIYCPSEMDLQNHVLLVHKRMKCLVCDEAFEKLGGLRIHIRHVHDKPEVTNYMDILKMINEAQPLVVTDTRNTFKMIKDVTKVPEITFPETKVSPKNDIVKVVAETEVTPIAEITDGTDFLQIITETPQITDNMTIGKSIF